MFYSALESCNHVIVIVTSDWSLLLFAFCSCCFYHSCENYSKLFKLFKLFVIMNWKDDQIEKLILFYSHNSLFLAPNFCYQKSCNWYHIPVPVFWYQFLVPVSGQYVMGITAGYMGGASVGVRDRPRKLRHSAYLEVDFCNKVTPSSLRWKQVQLEPARKPPGSSPDRGSTGVNGPYHNPRGPNMVVRVAYMYVCLCKKSDIETEKRDR